MAGHSKWANIKHRKARQDAARGKVWSRCSKAIIVAAKAGGGDPSMNLTLRYAIEDARAENMPKDNITRASNGARVNLVKMSNTPPFAMKVMAAMAWPLWSIR